MDPGYGQRMTFPVSLQRGLKEQVQFVQNQEFGYNAVTKTVTKRKAKGGWVGLFAVAAIRLCVLIYFGDGAVGG